MKTEQLIKQEIRRHGPLPFSTFMDLALYHPRYGYYQRRAPQRGREGDYFTAYQVSDFFPKILAHAVLDMKKTLGTEQFHFIEMGAGSGEFLEGLLKEWEQLGQAKGIHVWAIEKSASARDQLGRRLSRFPKTQVLASMEEMDLMGGVEGCVFSNEFFDAIPFDRWRWTGAEWKEMGVGLDGEGLVEVELAKRKPPLAPSASRGGYEVEVRSHLKLLWQNWTRLLNRGYVITLDYGHPRSQLHSPHRLKGTWKCFYRHQMNQNPFENLGRQDITAHVDFTQLAELGQEQAFDPALFCSQGILLTHLGQEILEKSLSEGSPEQKRKKMAGLQQLIHPDAMGESFWALIQKKEVDLPPRFQSIPNRTHRLKKGSGLDM